MNDLYRVPTQRTWKGKTAGGWLKDCVIDQSKAGPVYIWLTVGKETLQVTIADDGDMVLTDYDGIVAALEMSDSARKILERMEREADKGNMVAYNGGSVAAYLAEIGRKGGKARAGRPAAVAASRENGKKGGRPRKEEGK